MKGILTTKEFKKKLSTNRGDSYIYTCKIGEHEGDIFTEDEPGAALVIGKEYEYQYTPNSDPKFKGSIKIINGKAFAGGSGGSVAAAQIAADVELKKAALTATVELIKNGKVDIKGIKESVNKIYILLKELKIEL